MLPDCERCGADENVTRFQFYDREDSNGEEWLCWDCRWPYIKRRVHPPRDDENGAESDTDDGGGQASLADFA